MKAYVLKVLVLATLIVLSAGTLIFSFRAPIPAEHWIPQNIAIRKHINSRIKTPKIYITGGSSVIFGFDTGLAEKELGRPVIHFGTNIGLRLEYLLNLARSQVHPGDVVVLALEANFWTDADWSAWQLRNAIAWDHEALEKNSVQENLSIYTKTFTSSMFLDLIYLPVETVVNPSAIAARTRPLDSFITEYEKNVREKQPYAFKGYSFLQFDAHGDLLPVPGQNYKGKGMGWIEPSSAHPKAVAQLTAFVEDMKKRQVKVYFANFPYILDGQETNPAIQEREAYIREVVARMGCEFIDTREQLRFPREMMFDTEYHLNPIGRERRTRLFIESMRNRLPPLVAPAPAP